MNFMAKITRTALRTLAGLLLPAVLFSAVGAQTIPQLPAPSSWQPSDLYECSQGPGTPFGNTSYRCTAPQNQSAPRYVEVASADGPLVFDGSTDNSTTIQAAINKAAAFSGAAMVVIPTSTTSSNNILCVKSPLRVSGNFIRLVGSSRQGAILSACGTDISVLTMSGFGDTLENITVFGKGVNNDTSSFGATHPAVTLASTCIECVLYNVEIDGGSFPVRWSSGEAYAFIIKTQYSYGGAHVYFKGTSAAAAGGWIKRAKLDQSWPEGQPSYGASSPNWTASTPVTVGQVFVISGPAGFPNFFIQCSLAGTTGTSQPTPSNFGISFSDGTAAWQLAGVASSGSGSLVIDSYTSEVYGEQVDMSGAFVAGALMENSVGGGTAPQFLKLVQSIGSQSQQAGIWLQAGGNVYLANDSFSCWETGCGDAYVSTSFTGQLSLTNSALMSGGYGADLEAGAAFSVYGNEVAGNAISGIRVGAAVSSVSVMGNNITNSPTGVSTVSGADYYNIIGNTCGTSVTTCVSDGASGAHSTVTGNH